MASTAPLVRDLSVEECWARLRDTTFGRLAYHLRGRTLIAPINFAVDGERLVFRTAEGSKFYALQVDDDVAFEIDSYDQEMAFSVVAQGKVEEIVDADQRREATVHLRPWVRTQKKHVFSLSITELTGREFHLDRPSD
jgi:nitroimidazol reductase NimA-like FMN-containing flavoprotein (pyridoxamine 5'-phosphate oxidase superfamily)